MLITNARQPKSLDAEQRNKRYLISMAVRVACFLGGVLSPTPWNWVLFAGAAVIPPIGILGIVTFGLPVDVASQIAAQGEDFVLVLLFAALVSRLQRLPGCAVWPSLGLEPVAGGVLQVFTDLGKQWRGVAHSGINACQRVWASDDHID